VCSRLFCHPDVFVLGQYGPPNDMLYLAPWNLSYQVAYCAQTYEVIARPYWIPVSLGGYNLQGASNIVFTNGNLDPWSGGGVTHNITGAPSVIVYMIEGVRTCRAVCFSGLRKPLGV
jgi:hypothetical protein